MLFETTLGKVRGRNVGDCIRIARLRYAEPPAGERRFAMPEPVRPWQGVYEADGASAIAPQLASRLAAVMGDYPEEQSEDCLHMEIWIPNKGKQLLPVMVFIHGGAFMSGGGAMACYDGAVLAARHGVVVVNISYRLGLLGFLSPAEDSPTNLGLHDQCLALRFIRREIASFGGDPGNITVIGQSAGALSIAFLIGTDGARELFDRAVLMSAPLGVALKTRNEAVALRRRLAELVNCLPDDVEAMRQLPVETLLAAQMELLRESVANAPEDSIAPPFMPVLDGDLVRNEPVAIFREGSGSWCPLIVGWTREEYAAFWFNRSDLEETALKLLPQRCEEMFPGHGKEALAGYRARRACLSSAAVLADLRTDKEFALPALELAAAQKASGGTAHVYRFDWQSPDPRIGACHCIELPFMFGNIDSWKSAPMIAGAPGEELAALANRFQDSLVAFSRDGNPASLGQFWPEFRGTGPIFHFDRVSGCGLPWLIELSPDRDHDAIGSMDFPYKYMLR